MIVDPKGFPFGHDGSKMRERLVKSFDRFEDVRSVRSGCTFKDLQVDIAIDLMAYEDSVRDLPIVRHPFGELPRLSGTTGTDFIDYIIGDRIVLPFHHHYLHRKIVQLRTLIFLRGVIRWK
jgi:hypothetical protein